MKIPYFYQKDLFSCGATASKMVLAYYGISKDEETLKNALKTNVKEGTTISNIKNYFEALGLICDKQQFKDQKLALHSLKKSIERENPTIVVVNRLIYNKKTPRIKKAVNWALETVSNHIIIVTDIDEEQVSFNDPIKEIGETTLSKDAFLKAWFNEITPGLMLAVAK